MKSFIISFVLFFASFLFLSCSDKKERIVIKKVEPKVVSYINNYIDSSSKSQDSRYTPLYTSRLYKAKVDSKYFKKLFSTYEKFNIRYSLGSLYTSIGFNEDNDDASALNTLPLMEKMIILSKIPCSQYAFVHRYKIYSNLTGKTTTYVDLIYTDRTETKYISSKQWSIKTE